MAERRDGENELKHQSRREQASRPLEKASNSSQATLSHASPSQAQPRPRLATTYLGGCRLYSAEGRCTEAVGTFLRLLFASSTGAVAATLGPAGR